MTDTSYIPLDNPDLSTIDPVTIGIDPTITTQSINASSQPFSINYNTGILNISKPVVLENATIGNVDLISQLPNPNLNNQLVLPQLQVGGTIMSNDIILGGNGTTNFISDSSGTFIYGNVNVSGIINNSGLTNKFSVLDNTVNSKADQNYLITNYYDKNQTDIALQGKANSANPTFTGTVTIPSLTLNGNDVATVYAQKSQVSGFVTSTGSISANYGQKTFSVNKTGTGTYALSWTGSIGSTYGIIGNIRNGSGYVTYNGTAGTSVNIVTSNASGTTTDLPFIFYTIG